MHIQKCTYTEKAQIIKQNEVKQQQYFSTYLGKWHVRALCTFPIHATSVKFEMISNENV